MKILNKVKESLLLFYKNMRVIEMVLIVSLAYVSTVNAYPPIISGVIIYMITDSVISRIINNKKTK